MPEPRWNLIHHIRQQIAVDAEMYANTAKLRCCIKKIDHDLTGGSENATLPTANEADHDEPE